MGNGKRWFWVGSRPAVRQALATLLGAAPTDQPVSTADSEDLVVVEARAGASAEALPTGHAFGGVSALKETKGPAVYVVVDSDDRIGAQLARFVLADGVLTWDPNAQAIDAHEWAAPERPRRHASLDQLLLRLQGEPGAARPETSLQRLLRFEREDSLQNRLQDAETGLFDGPYAALKLDEEWKRAHRFHQPLSLLLLDLGPAIARLQPAERRLVFAEAAGVFLNECRDIDVLARFAPTVFLFLLPGTGRPGAEILARRILRALSQRWAKRGDVGPVCGLCSVPSSEVPDRRAFLAIAEACLAKAQAQGPGTVGTTWQ